jgi:hypothetical protein
MTTIYIVKVQKPISTNVYPAQYLIYSVARSDGDDVVPDGRSIEYMQPLGEHPILDGVMEQWHKRYFFATLEGTMLNLNTEEECPQTGPYWS